MIERTRSRAPWIVWGIVVTFLLVTLALAFRNGSVSRDALAIAVSVVMMVGYLTTGAVVASRARNRLGWLMIAVGAGFLVTVLGEETASYGLRTSPGSLPQLVVDAALIGANVGLVAALLPIPMLLAVFPTGRGPLTTLALVPAGADRGVRPARHRIDPESGSDRREPRGPAAEPDGGSRRSPMPSTRSR